MMSSDQKALEEIDQLVQNLYSSICFNKGEKPPLDNLKKVMLPDAKMMNNDGETPRVWTPEEYIKRWHEMLANHQFESFHEIEIAHKTEIFGKIAHRFSTYETKLNLDDSEPYAKGINSIQLIKIGPSWFVTSIIWNNQTDDRRIPQKYL
jgi:hypothetical protein